MKSRFKLLLTFLFLLHTAHAQGPNTVYQQLFTAATAIGNSAPARNVGQQYHVITATSTGGFCASMGMLGLQASFDNVNYFPIGVSITPSSFNYPVGSIGFAITSASGAYPYVRAAYSVKFGGCTAITVNYVGTLTGTLIGTAPFTAQQDTFQYLNATSSSTSPITNTECPALQALQIYAITVTAPGGANTVTVSRTDGVTSVYSIDIPLTATNPIFAWPQSIRPFLADPFLGTTGNSVLSLQSSAATKVDYQIAFRCE